jgi:hypothetical protein
LGVGVGLGWNRWVVGKNTELREREYLGDHEDEKVLFFYAARLD